MSSRSRIGGVGRFGGVGGDCEGWVSGVDVVWEEAAYEMSCTRQVSGGEVRRDLRYDERPGAIAGVAEGMAAIGVVCSS